MTQIRLNDLSRILPAACFAVLGALNLWNDPGGGLGGTSVRDWIVDGLAILAVSGAIWRIKQESLRGTGHGTLAINALFAATLSLLGFPAFWVGIYALFVAATFILGGFSNAGPRAASRTHIAMVVAAIGLAVVGILVAVGYG
ncbi:MAG: hypothetical protein ABI577_05140 [bacterium]